MNVMIVATKGCSHRPNLEKELRDLGVAYELVFVEDHPEVVEKYGIRHSPNLIVDDQVVCRQQPSESELRRYLRLD